MFRRLRRWLEAIEWSSIVGTGLLLAFLFLVPGNAIRSFAEHRPQQQPQTTSQPQGPQDELDSEGFWVRALTDPIAAFTLVLAISTIGLWIVTWLTLRHARADATRQAGEMQASIDASNAANKLTREIYASTERPWVYVKSARVTRARKIPDGRWLFDILFTIKNGGRAPAIRAWVHGFQEFREVKVKDQMRERASVVFGGQWGIGLVLFPGEEDGTIPMICELGLEEAKSGAQVCGAGFASYEFLTDGTHHFTNFSFSVIGTSGRIIKPDQNADSIPIRELVIEVRADGNAS